MTPFHQYTKAFILPPVLKYSLGYVQAMDFIHGDIQLGLLGSLPPSRDCPVLGLVHTVVF